jgi:hypothetical protein
MEINDMKHTNSNELDSQRADKFRYIVDFQNLQRAQDYRPAMYVVASVIAVKFKRAWTTYGPSLRVIQVQLSI